MTTYLSASVPEQPAFLYAKYGPFAVAFASSSAAGYLASDVLQADECNGWKPASTEPATIIIDHGVPTPTDFIAIAANALLHAGFAISGSYDNVTYSDPVAAVEALANGSLLIQYPQINYRYIKILLSGHSTAFVAKHIACGRIAVLPYLDDGVCLDPIQAEGTHLISHAGLFLGSVTNKVTRPFSLNWGQVDEVEAATFTDWALACISTARGFFFVPDLSRPVCYFGYVDKNFKFTPAVKTGMASIPAIPFTSRVTS
jgi:hypothetical protein